MIDILYFMILYGEDWIIFVKKVAMVFFEFIIICYFKDMFDIIVFGNDVWCIEIKDLFYFEVGLYYINIVVGLELAMDILCCCKNLNK